MPKYAENTSVSKDCCRPRPQENENLIQEMPHQQTLFEAPRRPVLRWHGGKWMIAKWIISHFSPHEIYVEPYGGSVGVFSTAAPVENIIGLDEGLKWHTTNTNSNGSMSYGRSRW